MDNIGKQPQCAAWLLISAREMKRRDEIGARIEP